VAAEGDVLVADLDLGRHDVGGQAEHTGAQRRPDRLGVAAEGRGVTRGGLVGRLDHGLAALGGADPVDGSALGRLDELAADADPDRDLPAVAHRRAGADRRRVLDRAQLAHPVVGVAAVGAGGARRVVRLASRGAAALVVAAAAGEEQRDGGEERGNGPSGGRQVHASTLRRGGSSLRWSCGTALESLRDRAAAEWSTPAHVPPSEAEPLMRVVAGSARGRRLVAPPGTEVRPTTDRVREAVFNALGSRDAVVGATVLDLFAGSGALGIEALSRGAAHATFVDSSPRALEAVRTNLDHCGLADRASGVREDVVEHVRRGGIEADLVFLVPPYAFDGWQELLDALPACTAVVESDREVEPPE